MLVVWCYSFGLGIPDASLCIVNLTSSQAQLVWDTYCT